MAEIVEWERLAGGPLDLGAHLPLISASLNAGTSAHSESTWPRAAPAPKRRPFDIRYASARSDDQIAYSIIFPFIISIALAASWWVDIKTKPLRLPAPSS